VLEPRGTETAAKSKRIAVGYPQGKPGSSEKKVVWGYILSAKKKQDVIPQGMINKKDPISSKKKKV